MALKHRRLVVLALAVLIGLVLGYVNAPLWAVYAGEALFLVVFLPWVMEGEWLWQMLRSRGRR